jgi:DNA (cytosine-5)-methyltransferase 1
MMGAYYNENDPFCAQWLRNLIADRHIAPGEVDERSIADVQADDLRGFKQCHFFAGIGVWSYALRLAGWADERPVWTGSCPCQPFSTAGRGDGYADERHLWPHWHRLISECGPATIFGEQVDAAIRSGWLDDVCLSLEQLGYAVGAVDFPAASVGAPHIRQRLYFVADAGCGSIQHRGHEVAAAPSRIESKGQKNRYDIGHGGESGDLGDAASIGRQWVWNQPAHAGTLQADQTRSFWSGCEWLPCRDGKARPVESGTFPLAHGAAQRVGRLRAYGNCLVAPQAAEFVRAYLG